MRLRRPQGNVVVLAVLRSRFHRLLSGMVVELRYTGRRSGRGYVLPVQYAYDGERLVVRPQAVQRAVWWRNFRRPAPVQVRLGGVLRPATARAVQPGEQGWDEARRRYAERWRWAAGRVTGPLVVITLELTGPSSNRQREGTDVRAGEQAARPSDGRRGVAGG